MKHEKDRVNTKRSNSNDGRQINTFGSNKRLIRYFSFTMRERERREACSGNFEGETLVSYYIFLRFTSFNLVAMCH